MNNPISISDPEFPYIQLKDIIKLPRKIEINRDVIFNISDV